MANKLFTHVDEKTGDPIITAGEEITYLLLINGTPKYTDAERIRDWEFVKGRQAAYDYIKRLLVNEGDKDMDYILDIDQSIIYAENPAVQNSKLKLSNGLSFYQFMRDCIVLRKIEDEDGFDIGEYHDESFTSSPELPVLED